MAFEKFEGSGQRGGGSSEPLISLRRSDSFGINAVAIEEWFEDATHVNLYYDEEENRVGIEPLEGKGPHSYKINETEGSGSISPSAFINSYGLGEYRKDGKTTRFRGEWDDDEELLVIDLDDPVGTYGTAEDGEEEAEAEAGE